MQIVGQDAYTKALMNLVASGEATPEQQAAFEANIDQQRLQATTTSARPSAIERSAFENIQQLRQGGEARSKAAAAKLEGLGFGGRGEYQRMVEDQETIGQEQLRERLMALQTDDRSHATAARLEGLGFAGRGAHQRQSEEEDAIRQEQLEFLDPKNRYRAQLDADGQSYASKQEQLLDIWQKAEPKVSRPHVLGDGSHTRRHLMATEDIEALGDHGMPGSTWERQHSPLLQKIPENFTAQERMEFEKLWKQYLARKTRQRHPKESPSDDVGRAALVAQESADLVEAPAVEDEDLFPQATSSTAGKYCKPFCDFLTDNPTVFHAVGSMKDAMKDQGWIELSERDAWDIKTGGKYYVDRNGSSLICFVVGDKYESGNGAAIIAGHVDALTAKLKPISQVPNKAGYLQLGVAPYAGGLGITWWDRDLGVGGRVLVKEEGKIVSKLVKLDWPIAKIPTLAPHFGQGMTGQGNMETQMVPILGLDSGDASSSDADSPLGGVGSFTSTQPPKLVRAIASELGIKTSEIGNIVQWELELFDTAPARTIGIDRDLISAGRIDDKLCSWAAWQALRESQAYATRNSSIIKVVGMFDDEEIGSLLRQGAHGNFLPTVMERAVGSLAGHQPKSDLVGRTYANSFLASCDVTHAVNPNFEAAYLPNHAPRLNTGVTVSADSNGHMTTDAVSTAIFQRCAEKTGSKLQVFQIRNDSRSGGTVGPMLSSMTGIRAIDAGIPQLSMHSIRATTGSLDPGLGVIMFTGFLNGYEAVDKEFR